MVKYTPTYNSASDSGSSSRGITDLTPGRAYRVDTRNLDQDEKVIASAADTSGVEKENRVEKFLRATKAAGKFQKKRMIDAPFGEGRPPAFAEGDRFGKVGSTNYPNKPTEPSAMF